MVHDPTPRARRHDRVRMRRTHPNLYRSITAIGAIEVLLAANYWWYTPTFNPYGISKTLVAVVFLALGLAHLVFLNLIHDLPKLRFTQMLSIGATFAWGVGNTQQVLDGRASWALPLVLAAFCVWQILSIVEPPVNPMTARKP